MDQAAIRDLFADVVSVRVRRMFGGHGIYADDRMFALESGGDIYLKADARTRGAFAAAGSRQFSYEKAGRMVGLGYWLLPEPALDDPEALRGWVALAREAAAEAGARPVRRRG